MHTEALEIPLHPVASVFLAARPLGPTPYFLHTFFTPRLWKSLFTNCFRFIWPHDGTVLFVFFRMVGLHCKCGGVIVSVGGAHCERVCGCAICVGRHCVGRLQ